MNPVKNISDTLDMMIKDLNLNLNTNEVMQIKEKALCEYCMKNNLCYFSGMIK